MERTTRPIQRGMTVAALLLLAGIVGAWLPAGSQPVARPVAAVAAQLRAVASPLSEDPSRATGRSTDAGSAASTTASLPRTPSGVPRFAHIYLIVMENREYGAIVGNTKAPYINSLIQGYGLATNYHAITHPSQPNYFALFAGRTFGIRDNRNHNITARNLTNQLRDKGRTWRVHAQNVPDGCFTGKAAYGGVDLDGLPGWYVRKHEPAISFTNISRHPRRCARIMQLEDFSPTGANFQLIIPNMTNDMHDGTIAQGDDFLEAFVPRITGDPAFAQSLLLITWEEGTTNRGGGGRVATIVVSPEAKQGFRSSISHNHYSLLRTIQRAWGLGCLNQNCWENDLREFFVT